MKIPVLDLRVYPLFCVLFLSHLPLLAGEQMDDFNAGNDTGWVHLDLSAGGLAASTYTFPSDGSGGSAYRIFSPAPPANNLGPARAFSYRLDTLETNFTVSVDIIAWDDTLDQAFGILARASDLGLGRTSGYVFNCNPHQFPGIPGVGELEINRITGEAPATIARAVISLIPGHRYRLVGSGLGSYLIARLYDLVDLSKPLASADVVDSAYGSGIAGLFNFSRASLAQQTNSTSSADTTFDNFFISDSAPTNLPPPLFHGTPQVIDSSKLAANVIDDFTDHTYSSNGVPVGAFADCTVTRVFPCPIKSIKVSIDTGNADDVGYVGNLLVTPNSQNSPPCSIPGFVTNSVDVTSQVSKSGNTATLVLRAKQACAPTAGWGTDTLAGRSNARLHWHIELTPPKPVTPVILNPANGHSYFLLSIANWTCSEREAVARGGHLATIHNQAEEDWVYQTFNHYEESFRSLWIGLNDEATEGHYVWSSGEPVTYTHWAAGAPNHSSPGDDYVAILQAGFTASGFWRDYGDIGIDPSGRAFAGVVEITSPDLVITSPAYGTVFPVSTNVNISLILKQPNSLIKQVKLYLENTVIATTTNALAGLNTLSPLLTDGTYYLHAEAADAAGALVTASPIVSITISNAAIKRYSVLDLGALLGPLDSRANAVNNSGVVAGQFQNVSSYRAFIYSNGVATGLPLISNPAGGGGVASAEAINDLGQVAGYSTTSDNLEHAFLYDQDGFTDINTALPIKAIAHGLGINNLGVVVGDASRAFIYSNGVAQLLGTLGGSGSIAFAINDRGQVVGDSGATNGHTHAFLYDTNQVMIDLGTPGAGYPDSFARSINNAGQITGYAINPNDALHGRAFLFDGTMKNLGTLGGTSSAANALNNRGQIVGTSTEYNEDPHAFLWQDGLMYDLNQLIPANSPFLHLQMANDINDCGQIAGYGNYPGSDRPHAFLLTPVPNLPPQIAILTPTNGAIFDVKVPVTIKAKVEDDGCLKQVGYFLNGAPLTVPFIDSSIVLSNLAPNTYTLTVQAADNLGLMTTSSPVSFTVAILNHPPIADASATAPLYLSPNGTNSTVVLNGARSFDPDGDNLQYYWIGEQSSLPIATGIVAIVTLPVGTNSITLVVSDGAATDTNVISIEVITSAQAVERLVSVVTDNVSRSQPLTASLRAAISSIDRSNPNAAISQLQAFQSKIRAQVEPLDAELAGTLITEAQQVIDSLDSVAGLITRNVKPKINRLLRRVDGKIRLEFSSTPSLAVVSASTNMVDWEIIGVGVKQGDGTFVFEDEKASRFSTRFYKILNP